MNIGAKSWAAQIMPDDYGETAMDFIEAHFDQEYTKTWLDAHKKNNPHKFYNPEMKDLICACGHAYYRHFDSYDNMKHVGCKYCFGCYYFSHPDPSEPMCSCGHPERLHNDEFCCVCGNCKK